jgi:hypothetical protein
MIFFKIVLQFQEFHFSAQRGRCAGTLLPHLQVTQALVHFILLLLLQACIRSYHYEALAPAVVLAVDGNDLYVLYIQSTYTLKA